jgi:RES domain-containing protein
MSATVELVVYRCTQEKHARNFDGAGAAAGTHNRWNGPGQFVTYAASSRALALLESRVHSPAGPPHNAVFCVAEISLSGKQVRTIAAAELPAGWRDPFEVGHCQIRGSSWYTEHPDEKLLIVPSAIVPAENGYVIRGGISEVKVIDVEPIEFDPRLWEFEHIDRGRVDTLLLESGAGNHTAPP